MTEDNKYKVSAKVNGKWQTFGVVSKNKFGNWGLGLKVSGELIRIINEAKDGEWVNFKMFDSSEDKSAKKEPDDF